jgi:ferrous iron transport protein B
MQRPGVMASRILETDGERLRVALASPFVICQARLLVIVLFAVFLLTSPVLQSGIVILIYLLSALLFMTATKFFGRIVKEGSSEILLELPPYHFPSLKVVWWITWERSKSFITKIAGLLLAFSIFAWLMEYLGLTSVIGAIVAKIFSPFGIEDPRMGFAILMGFFAKELIISSLAVSFGTADLADISAQLGLSAAQALALIVFVAFYTPCVATISAMHAEVRNFRLQALSIAFQLIVAWTLAFIIFLIFSLL